MGSDKYIVIIRGLSGAGKTTLADIICGNNDACVTIAADDYFYNEDGVYEFDAEQLRDAHDWCKTETESCMTQGFKTIVVHNTFTRRWEVEPYIQLASKHNYRVIVTSLFDSGKNDAELAGRSEHGIEIYNVRNQRRRWESDVFRTEDDYRRRGRG